MRIRYRTSYFHTSILEIEIPHNPQNTSHWKFGPWDWLALKLRNGYRLNEKERQEAKWRGWVR